MADAPSRRQYPGGYYKMNHESFGAMMLSEQLRPALVYYTKRIRSQAQRNTRASSTGSEDSSRHLVPLADQYAVERGPIVIIKGQKGEDGPRISLRVVNRARYAAAREFGTKGVRATHDLRNAGMAWGDLAGEEG